MHLPFHPRGGGLQPLAKCFLRSGKPDHEHEPRERWVAFVLVLSMTI
jgi:hypothetical protein